jgi:glycosyltransferase involved in cell wall biosynthesis
VSILAVRISKFAKYLPEYGWEPIVLTADKTGVNNKTDDVTVFRTRQWGFGFFIRGKTRDKPGIKHINRIEKQHYGNSYLIEFLRKLRPVYSLPVFNFIFEPIGWYRNAVKTGLSIIKNNKIDMIFSTHPPRITNFIAKQLHKRTGIPWVAEFRDHWSYHPHIPKVQPLYYFEQSLEKNTLKYASGFITVTDKWADDLKKIHNRDLNVIPNGYDTTDYQKDVPLTGKFTITYTGTIYDGRQDPSHLLKAIGMLKDRNKIKPDEFEVRFFGSNVIDVVQPLIHKYNIEEYVKACGFVPFKDSINYQKESTVLLLLGWNDPRDAGTLPAKIFEYFGAGRPILALGYEYGEMSRVLNKSGCGLIANNTEYLAQIIEKWYGEFRRNKKITSDFVPNTSYIKQFTRQSQAMKLAAIFDDVLKENKHLSSSDR